MNFRPLQTYFAYGVIVIFWACVIIGSLYLPDVISQLYNGRSVLRILSFGGIVDAGYVRQFEEQMGIKIEWSYYASNEELQAKLKKTGGKGYDLIVPSDYAVQGLRQHNFLKPLDHTRMPFLKDINPRLLDHQFDPGNVYSVPFEWELYGIGYNAAVLGSLPSASWKDIFTKSTPYNIIMLDDPIEAILCAVQYTYGKKDFLSEDEQIIIKELLHHQKSWVEAYTSTRAGYYLATGSSPLALTSTSYILNARKFAPSLMFALPAEGGFITIENFAIPVNTQNDDLVYQFLAFIFSRESAVHHFEEYANFPALADATFTELGEEFLPLVTMDAEQFKKLQFFKPVIPEDQVRDFWVAVKS